MLVNFCCPSSVEVGIEESSWEGWLVIVTCSYPSCVADDAEAAGVSVGWTVSERATCRCLSSKEDGAEAAGVSVEGMGWEDVNTAVEGGGEAPGVVSCWLVAIASQERGC